MSLTSHLLLAEIVILPGREWTSDEPCWLLARIVSGQGFWLEHGAARAAAEGQLLVIQPNTAGRFHSSQLGCVKIQFFRWRPELSGGILSLSERRYFALAAKDKSLPARILGDAGLNERFQALAGAPGTAPPLTVRLKLLELIGEIFNEELARHSDPPAAANIVAAHRFKQLMNGMTESELLDSSSAQLARRCGCSERHFSRLFLEHFGTSIRARQTELRLRKASLLLIEGNNKIIDVAMDSGYRHLGLFNNLFKKHLGMTPSQWRQRNTARPPLRRRSQRAAVFAFLVFLAFLLDITASAAPQTNAPPGFKVTGYDIEGNTVLSKTIIDKTLKSATGEHITLDEIRHALSGLQLAYRDRGFVTVKVLLPQQRLTNGIVRVQIVESRLAEITVTHNRYFSSNNVMRALPELHTNMLLNSLVFQQDLDRANASKDRQIYPEIAPGPGPGTTALRLKVVDRLPLHARMDFNNEFTPGTPETRAGLSLADDNLWQLDHQFGIQYTFSPSEMKDSDVGSQSFFDDPRVVSYSGFYRLPLPFLSSSASAPLSSQSFGYDEVSKRFIPPSPQPGPPELIAFASRGVVDTGNNLVSLTTTPPTLGTNGGVQEVDQRTAETITINEDLGFRLSKALPDFAGIHSSISGGVDYKSYHQYNASGRNITASFYVTPGSPPLSQQTLTSFTSDSESVNYLPFALNWDANRVDAWGITSFFLYQNINFNALSSSGPAQFATVAQTSTANADGNYYVLDSGLTREQKIIDDWAVTLKADGQWANQSLIGNEQFGTGGIPGPRGYRNGEEYGDSGWRVSGEPHTPSFTPFLINDKVAFRVNGSIFMDYGERYDYTTKFTNPNGVALNLADRAGHVSLWGTGVALNGVIGKIYEFHFALGIPLIPTGDIQTDAARFYFSLSAQF